MMPLKLATGAPSGAVLLGLVEMIKQSRNSSFLNDKSVPVFSASWMLNLVFFSAICVSFAVTGPMAFMLMVKVAVLGPKIAPTLSASIEWTGERGVVIVVAKESMGVTTVPSSKETSSREFQSGMLHLSYSNFKVMLRRWIAPAYFTETIASTVRATRTLWICCSSVSLSVVG